jgi:hypothetical protein
VVRLSSSYRNAEVMMVPVLRVKPFGRFLPPGNLIPGAVLSYYASRIEE